MIYPTSIVAQRAVADQASMRKQNRSGALDWIGRGCTIITANPTTKKASRTWDCAATTELGVCNLWRDSERPDDLIGVLTGPSDLVAFDFDKKNGGLESFNKMAELYPELKDTYLERTRSGGLHAIFKRNGLHVKNGVNVFMKKIKGDTWVARIAGRNWSGVDIRGEGGFLVVAPSIDENGEYKAINNNHILPLPKSLENLLREVGKIIDADAFEKDERDPAYKDVEVTPLQARFYREEDSPPCIKNILNELRQGKVSNYARFALLCYLNGLHMDKDAIMSVFSGSSTFKRERTEYHVNYGIEKGYKCLRCATIDDDGLCPGKEGCNADRSPAWNYRYNRYVKNWTYDTAKDDTGIAEMLADLYGDEIRYVRDTKDWLVWNGAYWPVDVGEAHLCQMITSMAGTVKDRVLFLSSFSSGLEGNVKKAHINHVKNQWGQHRYLRSRGGMANIIAVASKVIGRMAIDSIDEMDKDKNLINLRNGVYNLDTGVFIPHGERTKPFLMTMQANVSYNPDAKRPRFDQFIKEITCGDEDLADYLQRSLGYALSGYTKEEKAFAWLGNGRNGKTKLAEPILGLMGDYATSVSSSAFVIPRNGNTRSFSFARLKGKRFIRCSEVPENAGFNGERVKSFISGDTVTAEEKGRPEFDYKPNGKLFFLVNHMPALSKDRSTETKIQVAPFNLELEPSQIDIDLEDTLKAEAEGILLWLIEGYCKWQANDLRNVPKAVKDASEQYWRDVDWFAAFLADMCVIDKAAEVNSGELYKMFDFWRQYKGFQYQSATAFGKRLNSSGFTARETKRNGRTVILRSGLKLKLSVEIYEELVRKFEEMKDEIKAEA